MNVEKLTCFHFRNYETMSFSFTPKCIHFLYGKNAQGKTNLIEAIALAQEGDTIEILRDIQVKETI